jgi:hypothetical protein
MEQATVLRGLFSRPEDSAAAHMVRDTLTVRPNMTVLEVVATVREHASGSLQVLGSAIDSGFLNLVDWRHEMPVVAADTEVQSVVFTMVFPQQVRASWSGQVGSAGLVTVTSHPQLVSGQW